MNPRVINTLNHDFVPVKVNTAAVPDLVARFEVDWTPVLLVLDESGKEHFRFVGFLPPQEFVAMTITGRATVALRQKRYDAALELYRELADRHPDSRFRPESLYWMSVCQTRLGDRDTANATRGELKSKYADSLWTIRLPS